ncbi:MAG: acyl-CoA dehydrogenase family protein, partial [Myxococcota bacterium]
VAHAAGGVAFAASGLVAPLVARKALAGPVALVEAADDGPVRFAPAARTLLVLDGDVARCARLEVGDVEPVRSNFGYPVGRIRPGARQGGDSLGAGSGPRLLAWWRVALAAEALGAMDAALRFTVGYLREREQFGRPIGSFQGVQHRLAECAVAVEGSRWLVYEAAAHGAPAEAAACAASYALAAAGRVHRETHQLSGAIGYTTEHDLHVWSMRLQALRLELGGPGAQLRALARERWGAPA